MPQVFWQSRTLARAFRRSSVAFSAPLRSPRAREAKSTRFKPDLNPIQFLPFLSSRPSRALRARPAEGAALRGRLAAARTGRCPKPAARAERYTPAPRDPRRRTTMGAATSTENAQPSESAPSYWSIMRQGYEELVNAIIRPPRADYDPARLGPTEFEFCGRSYRREDLVLRNARGLALQCSHWAPLNSKGEPCVVFLHGNSSARLEGLNQLSVCLGFGLTLFAFDCAGSGRSEGDYVSLGFWEKDDLKCVVDHLRRNGVKKIGVWGRSMGAVTALLHQAREASPRNPLWGEAPPPIKHTTNAMVLDSPCQGINELIVYVHAE